MLTAPGVMLAMSDAARVQPLGDLFVVHACHPQARPRLPFVRFTCRPRRYSLRALPAKTAARQRLIAVSDYAPPLSTLLHQFKFAPRPEAANALSRLLLLAVLGAHPTRNPAKPDMIISVPLHARRQWRRGFNQSDLLCQKLAHWLQCSAPRAALRRLRATPVQHHLSARLRKQNLKNAFRLELPVAGLHIVVVDDVVTTGSTVAEITRLLLRSGAATVQVWCLCRTL